MTQTRSRWSSVIPLLVLPAAVLMTGCEASSFEEAEEGEPGVSTERLTSGYFDKYTAVATLENVNGCTATEAFGVGSTYAYSIKIRSSEDRASIYRTNMSTGSTTLMENGDKDKTYATYLGHANDMALATIDGEYYMFVATMARGGSLGLVKLKYSGTTYSKAGSYVIRSNGESKGMSGVKITSQDANNIHFLFKDGRSFYRGSIPLTAKSGTIDVTRGFEIDIDNAKVDGDKIPRLGSWVAQGMGYHRNTLYVPLTHENASVVLVYRNISDATGTIQADDRVSFRITSSAYPESFEIESLGVNGTDGRLWFNANRKKKSSNGSDDAVGYFKGFTAF